MVSRAVSLKEILSCRWKDRRESGEETRSAGGSTQGSRCKVGSVAGFVQAANFALCIHPGIQFFLWKLALQSQVFLFSETSDFGLSFSRALGSNTGSRFLLLRVWEAEG